MHNNAEHKKRWLTVIKRFWERLVKPILKSCIQSILIGIVILVVATFLISKYINPPSLANISSIVTYYTGPLKEEPRGSFKLDYSRDAEPAWLTISIINDGDDCAKDLAIGFNLLKNNKIINTSKIYTPKLLNKKVTESIENEKSFYEILNYLPAQSSIQYTFELERLIKCSDEFECSVCSRSQVWPIQTEITPKYSKLKKVRSNIAYADEKLNKENRSKVPGSGILIGGYDPLVMSKELFKLLQDKNLIRKKDALEIKKIIESYKEGILFSGINILKFNELIINKLLLRGRITNEQAKQIIKKSKNAGGILIGGYNVIILEVEILNSLLENGKITLEEGQRVIDRSKPNGS